MVTEILGFLIIFGALIVIVVRWWAHKQEQPQRDYQAMQVSTARLKEELEHSGEAIVERMGSHVRQLENLIKEADERAAQLDSRIATCRRLEAELEVRTAELSQRAQQTMAAAQLAGTPAVPPLQPVQTATVTGTVSPQQPAPEAERLDAQDFASVLHDSIAREERESMSMQGPKHGQAAELAAAVNNQITMSEPEPEAVDDTVTEAAELDDTAESAETEPEAEVPAAARARALLLSGYSVEETMRETGLGQGAVQLIQEMNRHALDEAMPATEH